MSIRPVYDLAVVQAHVEGEPFGEALNPARVTFLGSGQGTIRAKIYAVGLADENDPTGPKRWVEVDEVIEGKTSEERSGTILLDGISRHLVEGVRLQPAEAHIRYVIEPKACQSCR